MKRALIVFLVASYSSGVVAKQGSDRAQPVGSVKRIAPARMTHPVKELHRHCGGSCLKSGSLSWYCKPTQSCGLDCYTSPPARYCHNP